MSFRIGQGVDVHPFAEERPLILGGVRISDRGGLAGHSDADAVLHAVVDAILGAIGKGDIGEYFPSTEPRWRGAESRIFIDEAVRLVNEAGGTIENVDITIVAEAPKLAPHRAAMRQSIAALLSIEVDRVNVKATTTEHLGFLGRGEGICALAVALVRIGPLL
ncbi:MAG TPA: 2-C-methyl-D-erythritol 2,4-cyclodiphosphate synthase [Thermoanaerobaculia bacterium]|nr:2-C-methyl-D-erythritol 2,4-cyclodiphosphate synthase [Thermoanaerobaculia bacterium]